VPGASVGITFSDLGYRTVDEVLRDADLAMYEAKAGGRGRVALFDSSMHEKVAEKLALENDLRHAIGEGQLSVHFQPLFELEPYKLSGFEALARWVHPQRGPVSPAVFIALAEESGHIEALTDWIIDHAVGQLAAGAAGTRRPARWACTSTSRARPGARQPGGPCEAGAGATPCRPRP
jgi:predicted signal transduction protein with EAL and GGDEF domain